MGPNDAANVALYNAEGPVDVGCFVVVVASEAAGVAAGVAAGAVTNASSGIFALADRMIHTPIAQTVTKTKKAITEG